MLRLESYLRIVSFFNFKNLPEVIKFDNKHFYYLFNIKMDSNQIFYSSLVFSVLLFIFCVFINFLAFFLGFKSFLFVILGLVFSFFLFYFLFSFPDSLVRLRIVDELSQAPLVMALLVSFLKINPNLESVINRVLKGRSDLVSSSLVRAVRKSVMGKNLNEELSSLAVSLGRFSEGFKRSLYLVMQAVSEGDVSRRELALDRALKVFIKEVEFNTGFFSQKLVSASVVVFTVGVVLPLVGLSVLPLLSFFGASSLEIVFVCLLVIVLFVWFFTNNSLVKRPVIIYLKGGFEKGFNKHLFFSSLVVFLVVSFPSLLFFLVNSGLASFGIFDSLLLNLDLLPFFWGFSASFCFYFYFSSRDSVKKIVGVESLEKDLPDVIYSVASDLDEGLPLEKALKNVSKRFGSDLACCLGRVYRLVRGRHLSVREAILKVFLDSGSFLVSNVFSFVSDSAVHGSRVVSSTLFSLSDHLSELRTISRNLRSRLDYTLSMMQLSVLFFAPVVCGLVVVLNSLISSSVSSLNSDLAGLGFDPGFFRFLNSNPVNSVILSLFSFFYLFVFTFIVSRFLVYVKNGSNYSILKFELSKILLIVTCLYSLTLLVSRNLLGV